MSETFDSERVDELYISGLRERLLESEARYATVLEIAADAIIVIDDEQRIKSFNQAAEKLFGYSAEQLVAQPLDLLLPAEVAGNHRRHVQTFSAGVESSRRMESRSAPIFGRRKDGTIFPAEVSIAKLTRNGKLAFVAVVREIEERSLSDSLAENAGGGSSEETGGSQSESGLAIDIQRHVIRLGGRRFRLSPTEFDLLVYLRNEAPRVVSPEELVREVQGYESDPVEARDIVRYHIYRIRRKAKSATGAKDLIRTVHGIGYALADKYLPTH